MVQNAPHFIPVVENVPHFIPVVQNAPHFIPVVQNVPHFIPVVQNALHCYPVVENASHFIPVVQNIPHLTPVVQNVPHFIPVVQNVPFALSHVFHCLSVPRCHSISIIIKSTTYSMATPRLSAPHQNRGRPALINGALSYLAVRDMIALAPHVRHGAPLPYM